ncbi:anthranilate synthase component I family protein [Taibaiella chishuiensis]|uniref:Anthranilate synthase component 1 n=1 Tax=Taibaiella chishuiensis TaxID=1434707 RepID=A0A2P8D5Q1_9BACT|nr:anthranilate synthase component I family protein [Taibaiella chishuiensis]PSK92553.1 anthranilate synthase component 1 [Taibaiella chishuiensis]
MTFDFKVRQRRLPADAHTPVSAYLKLRDLFPRNLLLESSDFHGRENSYSYLCFGPVAGLELNGNVFRQQLPDGSVEERSLLPGTLVETVTACMQQYRFEAAAQPGCTGRFFGHVNYDAVQHFEQLELRPGADALPSVLLQVYRYMLVFDHFHHALYLTEHYTDEAAPGGLDFIEAQLRTGHPGTYHFRTDGAEQSQVSDQEYLDIVAQARKHCLRGDVFQMVLSRGFSIGFKGDDFNVYRALRTVNPSPYLFYADYGNYRLFGSSPEAQLKIEGGRAVIHPIAGTCRRTGNEAEDKQLAEALLADPKENAEHVMLVDLARNDLSRSYDEVHVTVFKALKQFAHVIHIVSEVSGEQARNQSPFAVLSEVFPAGTLSGAPKHMAMQLIDKLERYSRGYYGGCTGFMSPDGDTNMAIMIRSFMSRDNTLYFRAGAGVVASSVPERELMEVQEKLKGLRLALELACTL